MIAAWMLRAAITAMCVTIAATLADRAARLAGRSQRWAWLAALLTSVAIPVAATQVTWGRPLQALQALLAHVTRIAPSVVTVIAGAPHTVPASTAPTWWHLLAHAATRLPSDDLLLTLWASASALVALLVLGTHVWTLARRGTWHHDRLDSVPVLVTPTLGPAVVGVLDPVIVVPAWILGTPRDARRLILQHEREHVIAHDPLLLALGALAVVAMPWNVCVWWQYRRLRAAVENDCDARVLARGHDVRQYGEVLLQVAARAFPLPVALASPGFGGRGAHLRRRIVAMTARRGRHRAQRAALIGGALAAAVVACDASATSTMLEGAPMTLSLVSAPPVFVTVSAPPSAPPRAAATRPPGTARSTMPLVVSSASYTPKTIHMELLNGSVVFRLDTIRFQPGTFKLSGRVTVAPDASITRVPSTPPIL